MKSFGKLILILFASVTFASTAAARPALGDGFTDGMPIPWPFPWAKDCEVDWNDLNGNFILADYSSEQVQISIHVVVEQGLQFARVIHYDRDGYALAFGMGLVSKDQHGIEMNMYPVSASSRAATSAVVRLYHRSEILTCSQDSLIPILTLTRKEAGRTVEAHYRLNKSESKGK
ncbi:MAG TPA: hypothetical protein PKC28_02320 [Bdellovibrionales bacterium]|nr:hypothetical protein [Bdellovibrionales bacterium]